MHYDERLIAPEQMKSAERTAGYQVDAVHDPESKGSVARARAVFPRAVARLLHRPGPCSP